MNDKVKADFLAIIFQNWFIGQEASVLAGDGCIKTAFRQNSFLRTSFAFTQEFQIDVNKFQISSRY